MHVYALCKAMSWTHLPVEGGLYDQHPALIDCFQIIMEEEAKAEKKRADAQRRQSATRPAATGGRRRR